MLSELMKIYTPKIEFHLKNENVMLQMFAVRWFMTLFSSTLKQELFYRIFEIYLYEGWKTIYATGLVLLMTHEAKILSSKF